MTSQRRAHLLLASLLLAGCTSEQPEQSARPEIGADVERFLENYMAAISARDFDHIRLSLVEDGRFVWVEDGEVRYRALGDLLSSLEQFPPNSPIRTELTDMVAVPVGDTGAHAWAQFQTTVGEGPGGFTFGGAISFVLERRSDAWKLVGGHTSAPRPR